jgi:arylsulfatase A-like enzyme
MNLNPVVLITMDAVRADHLGCYGYTKITTPSIDEISKQGVTFDNCITASSLTPVSHASILTGNYPNKHTVRNPFGFVKTKTLAQILKDRGYRTAGFTGIDFLSSRSNFNAGFDFFDEPSEETAWHRKKYKDQEDGNEIDSIWGNWWVDKMLKWIQDNHDSNFFVWGHYFECHVAAERWLLKFGLIKKDVLPEWDYYDAKIQCMDRNLFAPLLILLKKLDLWDDTTFIVMSDHGETFDEHPHKDSWCQHQSVYNTDLKMPLIIKNRGLRKGSRIKDLVRSIDVVPTVLSLLHMDTGLEFDGVNLEPMINSKKKLSSLAYSEEMYELRGSGALQAVQNEKIKLIRNNTLKQEEFYDLQNDPDEKNNLIGEANWLEDIERFRNILDQFIETKDEAKKVYSEEEKEKIKDRLRSLGYID